jgi:putative peptidoglycan lipid II flippase
MLPPLPGNEKRGVDVNERKDGQGAAAGERKRILRAAWVFSSATALSRVLGLVRDSVTAALFGAGGMLDAFFVAFRLPNMLRSLLAEGSLTVSFVPIFIDVAETEGEKKAEDFARVVLTFLSLLLLAVVALGVLFAPQLVKAVAMGFERDPEKFGLTVELTRIVFPFIGFVGVTALLSGILNARGVFLYPALAPVILNVFIIAAALTLAPVVTPPVASLAYGVVAGGVGQLLLQLWPLRRMRFRFRPAFDWKNPALRKAFLLFVPSVFGVAVYQINIVVSTALASWLPDGSVSYLYYAERVFQLPLGVFAVSVGMASLPSLSRLASREEWEPFRETLRGSLRLLLFVVLPATVGMLLLADPIVLLLFKRGKFDALMAAGTVEALRFYALALLPVAMTRLVVQGFYAMKDTRTPVIAASLTFGVNLAASLLLMGPLKHGGLALATAISSAFNIAYLCWAYRRRMGEYPFRGLFSPLARMTAATVAMGAAVWGVSWFFGETMRGAAGQVTLGALVLSTILGGIVVYGLSAKFAGLSEYDAMLQRLKKRRAAADLAE